MHTAHTGHVDLMLQVDKMEGYQMILRIIMNSQLQLTNTRWIKSKQSIRMKTSRIFIVRKGKVQLFLNQWHSQDFHFYIHSLTGAYNISHLHE